MHDSVISKVDTSRVWPAGSSYSAVRIDTRDTYTLSPNADCSQGYGEKTYTHQTVSARSDPTRPASAPAFLPNTAPAVKPLPPG